MEMDEVGGRWTFSRTNEGYTSCGPVVEMSWHRVGALLLGAQSCLPVPEVPAVGGMVGLGWLGTSWDPGSGCQFGLNHRRPWVKAVREALEKKS
uniref:Zinc knuckle domain containing protein-like n=1 Tax=Oryza sativa subsp. japonica TaxID=39947 RepID=Q5Z6S7_ORYSJ|nr:zinc knuckle domain containing protein-like [Oryza sativa Japonica Group]BAD54342.1 zinc knuckle domain containing protein-like [Oryza sativa Japonica Group]